MAQRHEMLRVRGETKARLRAIALKAGWKMTEAADRAVRCLEKKNNRRRRDLARAAA